MAKQISLFLHYIFQYIIFLKKIFLLECLALIPVPGCIWNYFFLIRNWFWFVHIFLSLLLLPFEIQTSDADIFLLWLFLNTQRSDDEYWLLEKWKLHFGKMEELPGLYCIWQLFYSLAWPFIVSSILVFHLVREIFN